MTETKPLSEKVTMKHIIPCPDNRPGCCVLHFERWKKEEDIKQALKNILKDVEDLDCLLPEQKGLIYLIIKNRTGSLADD